MDHLLDAAFRIEPSALHEAANGLTRPECLLALASGELIAAHGGGGYTVLRAGQAPRHVLAQGGNPQRFVPNGIALSAQGDILFANLGAELGGVFRIDGSGAVTPVVEQVDGEALPPTNFVLEDADRVLWFTVSTRIAVLRRSAA